LCASRTSSTSCTWGYICSLGTQPPGLWCHFPRPLPNSCSLRPLAAYAWRFPCARHQTRSNSNRRPPPEDQHVWAALTPQSFKYSSLLQGLIDSLGAYNMVAVYFARR
jgi:hypothetical protein